MVIVPAVIVPVVIVPAVIVPVVVVPAGRAPTAPVATLGETAVRLAKAIRPAASVAGRAPSVAIVRTSLPRPSCPSARRPSA